MQRNPWFRASPLALLLSGAAAPAMAIDIIPGDYTLLPSGTTLGLIYLQRNSSDELNVEGVGEIAGSNLDASVGIARAVHYSQIGDLPVAYQAFIPYVQLSDVRIGGVSPPIADGIGDLTLGFTAFLARPVDAATGTTVGLTAYLTTPTGRYDAARPSVGSGTYTLVPQLGVIHGFGNGWFFDGAVDVSIQRDHRENGVEISVDPSAQLQAYARYQPSPVGSFSVGYSGLFGGKQEVDGSYTGQKSRSDSLRLVASRMLSPSFQIIGMLGSEVRSDGGFRDRYSATLRFMKVF